MSKAQAGRLGGQATLARHGSDHFRTIGQKGAAVFHARYRLEPIGANDFLIIDRETNEAVNSLSGKWRAL